MHRVLALIGLGGCDAVLNLHHLPPGPIDASPDTLLGPQVTGRLREKVVSNNAAGNPVITDQVYAATDVQLAVTLADGTHPDAAYDETTGTFTFALAAEGQAYRVDLTTPEYGTIDYQLAAPAPHITNEMLNRLDRVPVTKPTTIQFQYGAASGFAIIDTTGVWTQTNKGVANTATWNLDWQTASPFTGALGLLDAAKYDRLHYLEFSAVGTAPDVYNFVTGYATAAITQTDGGTTMLPGALSAPLANHCVHVVAARNQALTRQLAALPRTYTGTGADWAIYAVPAQSLGMLGFFIALGNENAPGTDVDLQAGFYNPFPGTEHIAAVGAGGNFDMLAPGASTPLTLNNGSRQWVAVDVSGPCFSNVAQPQLTMSIPQIVYANSLALAADNQALGLADTPDVVLTWTNTSGPVDAALVTIFEVQKQGAATTIAKRYTAYTSTRGSAIVPRDQLQAGKTYIVEIIHVLGVDAANGDLETQHYPLGQAVAWSHTFQP